MNSLKGNIVYQLCYRLLTIITPLITSPYLSRVLGAEKLGIYSYTLSIVNYFIMFAALGTETYGSREIARISSKKDDELLSKTFWGIYFTQFLMSAIAILFYLFYIFFISRENTMIALLQVGWIVSTLLDINWFFFGMEQVKYAVVRNFFVKAVSVICILMFVNNAADLGKYAFIMACSMLVSQLFLWSYVPKFVQFVPLSRSDVKKHIAPNLRLFIPLIGSNVYWTMDKTMLGLFSDYNNTGYYYNADKVMNIPLSLVIGLGAVMLPRMSSVFESNGKKDWEAMMIKTTELYLLMACSIAGGIAAIAEEFVPLFFGQGYEPCIMLIICFSPVLILKAVNDMLKNQCILPLGQERAYTIAVFCGAVANFCTNWMLIQKYGAMGALIGTAVAEVVVLILEVMLLRKEVSFVHLLHNRFYYILIAFIMYFIVRVVADMFVNYPVAIRLAIEIFVGIISYSCGCLLFWKWDKASFIRQYILDRMQGVRRRV